MKRAFLGLGVLGGSALAGVLSIAIVLGLNLAVLAAAVWVVVKVLQYTGVL